MFSFLSLYHHTYFCDFLWLFLPYHCEAWLSFLLTLIYTYLHYLLREKRRLYSAPPPPFTPATHNFFHTRSDVEHDEKAFRFHYLNEIISDLALTSPNKHRHDEAIALKSIIRLWSQHFISMQTMRGKDGKCIWRMKGKKTWLDLWSSFKPCAQIIWATQMFTVPLPSFLLMER